MPIANTLNAKIHQTKSTPTLVGEDRGQRPTANDAREPWRIIILTGAILALQFTLAQFSRRSFVALNLVLFGVFWVFSQSQRRRMGQIEPRLLFPLKGGMVLVAVNLLIITWQRSGVEGPMAAVLTTIHELCIIGSLLTVYVYAKARPWSRCLAVFVSMTMLFALANIIAERLGLGITSLTDRMEVFESRVTQGAYRWQSPLFSAWQLSGLLRVTVPLALYILALQWIDNRRLAAGVWCVLVGFGLLVLWRVEYRASAMPLIFLACCLALPSTIWRTRTMAFVTFYPLVAPFLFTSLTFEALLLNRLPDFVPSVLGQRLQEVVTLSSRTEMWRQGIDGLANGAYLFIGEGHYLLDCTTDIDVEGQGTSELFRRISFHQAVLDQFFIYGTLPAIAILIALYWCILSAIKRIRWPNLQRISSNEGNLALMFLSLVAVANAHDGFFLEGTYMYLMVAIAVNSLWLSARERAAGLMSLDRK